MQIVDDRAWTSVPPGTGRLRPRTLVLIVGLALAVVITLSGVAVLGRNGVFRPQLSMVPGWDGEYIDAEGHGSPAVLGNRPAATVRSSFYLKNVGWTDLRVLNIEVHGDGFQFLRSLAGEVHPTSTGFASGGRPMSSADPYPLASDEISVFSVEVLITDCNIVTTNDAIITVDSWHGTQTTTLSMPLVRQLPGGWSLANEGEADAVGGLRYLAGKVCGD